MLCILSPSKTTIPAANVAISTSPLTERSIPIFSYKANELVEILKAKSKKEIKDLCGVSDPIAVHIKNIYDSFRQEQPEVNDFSRFNQAVHIFDGPAFRALDAGSLSTDEGTALQRHLRILTGLYGYVKPGDLIQEHRLCMGTKLNISKEHPDLYSYWGGILAQAIMKELQELNRVQENGVAPPLLINCASQEYSKSVLSHLSAEIRVVDCVFYDGGLIKSVFAKRARGLMARFVCLKGIANGSDAEVDKIKAFNSEGYVFSPTQSNTNSLVFTRTNAAASGATTKSDNRKRKDVTFEESDATLAKHNTKKARGEILETAPPEEVASLLKQHKSPIKLEKGTNSTKRRMSKRKN